MLLYTLQNICKQTLQNITKCLQQKEATVTLATQQYVNQQELYTCAVRAAATLICILLEKADVTWRQ